MTQQVFDCDRWIMTLQLTEEQRLAPMGKKDNPRIREFEDYLALWITDADGMRLDSTWPNMMLAQQRITELVRVFKPNFRAD